MKQRVLAASIALIGSGLAVSATAQTVPNQFTVFEATVPQIQAALQSRLLSSEELVKLYQARIAAFDDAGPRLNAFLTLNPRAAAAAKALDDKRFLPGTQVGPLYGVPVALKDIIDTADLPTTGGAIALKNSIPRDDAFITRKLRQAGAIILGKLTLTEFANYIGTGVPGGYSGLGGYGFNPYDLRLALNADGSVRDGRPLLSPSGSSSGSGIATTANLTALSIGTETSGSILSPSSANGIVGIKPTVGLVSRDGIIPITADQDTAGPMTRTVTDAAILLGVIAGEDPSDPATAACQTPGNCYSDYTPFLKADALRGARLAVPPFPSNRAEAMEAAIAKMEAAGATIDRIPALSPVRIPGTTMNVPGILNYGQKRDVNAYLSSLPDSFPIRSLADLIAFNANPPLPLTTDDTIKYTQTQFINSNNLDISAGSVDTATYIANRDLGFAVSRDIIDGTLNGPDGLKGTADDYDAVVYSGSGSAGTWARAGYPSIVLPLTLVESNEVMIPSGISFAGRKFGEPKLIALGYAFEQINQGRVPPASAPALATDTVLRGDVNRDGVVDSTDIKLTANRNGRPANGPYDRSDLNGDGRITGADVSALTKLCSAGPGCGGK